MELALRLGRTFDELGRTMSALEFELWCEYRKQSPWDSSRSDFNAALICATLANYAGMTRKDDAPPASAMDFMPFVPKSNTEDVAVEIDPAKYFRNLVNVPRQGS